MTELSLFSLQQKLKTILNVLWWITLIFTSLLIVSAIILHGNAIYQEYISKKVYNQKVIIDWTKINVWMILFGGIFSIVGHEIGHLLSANHYGIEWKSITIALKWGISPVYYIRYKNFYMHESWKKIIVILSGIWMNIAMIATYFILYTFKPGVELLFLITVNVMNIISNILPKGTSDGYHFFSTLIGIEGIRWKMLKKISEMLNNPKQVLNLLKDNITKLLFIYFVTSYGVSIYGCFRILNSLLNNISFLEDTNLRMLLSVLVTLVILLGFILNFFKLFKSVKRMDRA